ncbi:hypothetical protein [Rhodocaloribacter sp.]
MKDKMRIWMSGLLALVVVFAFTACDSPTSALEEDEAATETTDEMAALAEALVADLNLTASEAASVTRVMTGQDGHGREPGFLWYVAADLQTTLTDEQKERLFDLVAQYGDRGGLLGEPGFPLGGYGMGPAGFAMGPGGFGMRRGGFGMGPGGFGAPHEGGLFDGILTDEQIAAVEAIRETYAPQFTELIEARRDGTLTHEAFLEEMAALRDAVKAEIDALLTDEQRAEIEARIEERRAEHEAEREAMLEQVRAAMKDALALTDEQAAAVDELFAEQEAEREAIFDQLREGTLTPEEAFAALGALKDAQQAALEALLDETQWEIVLIHDALTIRGRRLAFARRGGAGFGGPGQGGSGMGSNGFGSNGHGGMGHGRRTGG